MPNRVYDHVDDQYAVALLGPIADQIGILENRTDHYVHHVRMSPEDRERVERARAVLEHARSEIEKLRSIP